MDVHAASVAFASSTRQNVHGKLTVASSRQISTNSIKPRRWNISQLQKFTRRMMRITLVSRGSSIMRRTDNLIASYAFSIPPSRLSRAIRWRHYSEALTEQPRHVGRSPADDDEDMGIHTTSCDVPGGTRRGPERPRTHSTRTRHQADGVGLRGF